MQARLSVFFLLSFSVIIFFKDNAPNRNPSSFQEQKYESYYLSHVKPIFAKRCVTCHACEAAPCQLKLDSYEGVDRGATTAYPKAIKIKEQPMTRIFKDSKTTEGWRKKGFWPVITHNKKDSKKQRLEKSLLYQYVMQGKRQYHSKNLKETAPREFKQCVKKTDDFQLGIDSGEFVDLGMPFGAPALPENEIAIIKKWIEDGAKGPTKSDRLKQKTATHRDMIDTWESFLNSSDNKHAWTAKYLYEHLYLAHFHFEDNPGEFFELQRSKPSAAYGMSDEIVTKFPYNNPKEKFEYRFNKIHSTIAHKVHIVYKVNKQSLKRIKKLFIDANWGIKNISNVSYKEVNPFYNFAQIPAKIRYRFLIENSRLLMDFFTRGPVCSGGSKATWVIQDHSWAFFEHPDLDISVNMPGYFDKVKDHLVIPTMVKAEDEKLWGYYRRHTEKYERIHANLVAKTYPKGRGLEHIWDGDGDNGNALLTLYRHAGYSVSVHKGQIGEIPKVMGLINYPIFERIYYDLVAGFNIWGSFKHKINSRLMITHLRRELEDNYISLLPKKMRGKQRRKWYSKSKDKQKIYHFNSMKDSIVVSDKRDAAKELAAKITNERLNEKTAGKIDKLNGHARLKTTKNITSKITNEKELQENLTLISGRAGDFAQFFPEIAYFGFKKKSGEVSYYTVIRNRAHHSVNYLFKEEKLIDEKNTSLNILKDFPLSFPLQFYTIEMKDAQKFIDEISKIKTLDAYKAFEARYGILKGEARFWTYFDHLNEHIRKLDPINAGVLDINRYGWHHFPNYKF